MYYIDIKNLDNTQPLIESDKIKDIAYHTAGVSYFLQKHPNSVSFINIMVPENYHNVSALFELANGNKFICDEITQKKID